MNAASAGECAQLSAAEEADDRADERRYARCGSRVLYAPSVSACKKSNDPRCRAEQDNVGQAHRRMVRGHPDKIGPNELSHVAPIRDRCDGMATLGLGQQRNQKSDYQARQTQDKECNFPWRERTQDREVYDPMSLNPVHDDAAADQHEGGAGGRAEREDTESETQPARGKTVGYE